MEKVASRILFCVTKPFISGGSFCCCIQTDISKLRQTQEKSLSEKIPQHMQEVLLTLCNLCMKPEIADMMDAFTNTHKQSDRDNTAHFALAWRGGKREAVDVDKCSLRPDYCSRINSVVPAVLSPCNFLQPKLFSTQGWATANWGTSWITILSQSSSESAAVASESSE